MHVIFSFSVININFYVVFFYILIKKIKCFILIFHLIIYFVLIELDKCIKYYIK